MIIGEGKKVHYLRLIFMEIKSLGIFCNACCKLVTSSSAKFLINFGTSSERTYLVEYGK